MLARTLIAAALLGAAPASAQEPIARVDDSNQPPIELPTMISYQGPPEGWRAETRIRNMSEYLEAVVDRGQGVFIRGYTGQWYYARTEHACPRLTRGARLGFIPSPGGDFDRDSVIRADGQRCLVGSVVESEGPPRRTAHR